MVNFPDISAEVSHFNKLFHQKLQASAFVGPMPMISMIITSQGFVSLGGIRLDRCWPFKLWKVANDGQYSFIRDVQAVELWELFFFFYD